MPLFGFRNRNLNYMAQQVYSHKNNLENRSFFNHNGSIPCNLLHNQMNGFVPIQHNQHSPSITNNGLVQFQPLNEEQMAKIHKEIDDNKQKFSKQLETISSDSNNIFNEWLSQVIQDERNGGIFYKALSDNCSTNVDRELISNISAQCFRESDNLNKLHLQINNSEYKIEDRNICVNLPFRDAVTLGVMEEMKSSQKICDILEQTSSNHFNYIYKLAIQKMYRINTLQYMLLKIYKY